MTHGHGRNDEHLTHQPQSEMVLTSDRPNLLATAPRGIIYAAFCAAIAIQGIYIFTFNWHPDLRLLFSSTLAAMHVVLAVLTVILRPANWHSFLMAAVVITIVTLIPPHMMGLGEVRELDLTDTVRRLALPLMMIWILAYPLALPVRLLWCAAVFGTLYAAYIAYTEPSLVYNINDPEPRLASITGGLDQVHPSAKFMAMQLVLLDLLRRGRLLAPLLSWALIGLCIAVMVGYMARAQFLFVAVYFLALIYFHYHNNLIVRWAPLLSLILAITAATIALQIGTNVETWGSGRIGTWAYRLMMVAGRDWPALLFGGGVGADNVWTPIWGWSDDPFIAHNDYLYFLMDHGLVGLLIPLFFFMALWVRTQEYGRAIVVAMAVSSFFDNGYFRSPLLAANLAIVIATATLVSLLRNAAATSMWSAPTGWSGRRGAGTVNLLTEDREGWNAADPTQQPRYR